MHSTFNNTSNDVVYEYKYIINYVHCDRESDIFTLLLYECKGVTISFKGGCGLIVICNSLLNSRFGQGLKEKWRNNKDKIHFISVTANFEPMHTRGPRKNGKYA